MKNIRISGKYYEYVPEVNDLIEITGHIGCLDLSYQQGRV